MPLVTYSSITIFQAALLVLFTIRSGRTSRVRRRLQLALLFATLAIFSFVLQDITIILGYSDVIRDSFFIALGRAFYAITFFLLYLFWEGGLNAKPDARRLALMSFLGGGSLSFISVYLISPDQYIGLVEFLGDSARSAFGFAVFIFGTYYQYRVQKVTRELTARVQYVGSIIIVIAFFVQFFATPILGGNNVTTFQAISDVLVLLGIFLYLIFYSINPKLVERIPVQTFEILVYSKTGMNFHSVQVNTKGIESEMDHEERVILMSGLSSAITEFLKSATGTEQDLETIQASDRVMIFSLGEIQISMVAEGMTEVLLDSLDNLRVEYEQHVNSDGSKHPNDLNPMESDHFSQMITHNFPYLDVVRVSTQGV